MVPLRELQDFYAVASLGQYTGGVVGHAHGAPYAGFRAKQEDVVHVGVFNLAVYLRGDDDGFAVRGGCLDRAEGALAIYE